MRICTKCGLNKSDDNFSTYWHSTQNCYRTRRYCKNCFRKQKIAYRNKKRMEKEFEISNENKPDYTQCRKCKVWKHKNDYYLLRGKISYNMCKSCTTEKDRAERLQYRKENCGSDFINKDPNRYPDEYQKECVFSIMRDLGYLFDESTGTWLKPGVKELIDGKVVFLKLKKKIPKEKRKRVNITTQHIKSVIELRKKGIRVMDIVKETGVSENSVYKIINTYGNQ